MSGGVAWGNKDFDPANLIGASDPLELTPLTAGETIVACTRCQVGYHLTTIAFLVQHNQGHCLNCGQADKMARTLLPGLVPAANLLLPPVAAPTAPVRFDEPLVAISDVGQYIGQIATIQGYVYQVHLSKSGTYFVKFARTRKPFEGFKLVIFTNYTPLWESALIDPKMYEGQWLRVRGLVQEHPTWGMEIIVSRPGMITVVEPKGAAKQRIVWH